jgi:hypothetical protein
MYELYESDPVPFHERIKFFKNIILLDSIDMTHNLLNKVMKEYPDDFLRMIAMDEKFLEQVLNCIDSNNDQNLQEMFVKSTLNYFFFIENSDARLTNRNLPS